MNPGDSEDSGLQLTNLTDKGDRDPDKHGDEDKP